MLAKADRAETLVRTVSEELARAAGRADLRS
jgi:hypothetical protein